MILSIITINIKTLITMTLSVTSVTAYCIMILSILKLVKMAISIMTNKIKDTYHNDTL